MSKHPLEDLFELAFTAPTPEEQKMAFYSLIYCCDELNDAFLCELKIIPECQRDDFLDIIENLFVQYYEDTGGNQRKHWIKLCSDIKAKAPKDKQRIIISNFAKLFKWRLKDELDKSQNKIKYVRIDEEAYDSFAPEDEVSANDTSEGYISVNELGNMFCSREEMSSALKVIEDAFNELSEKQKIIAALRAKVMEYKYCRNEHQPMINDEIILGVEIARDSFIHSDKDIVKYLKEHHPKFNINNVGDISSVMQDVRMAIKKALVNKFGDEIGQEIYNRYKRLGKHKLKRSRM